MVTSIHILKQSAASMLAALCFFTGLVSAQAVTVFDTSNSDLPYPQVNCIAPDPSGDVWVGTEYGLARFDGVASWTVYDTANSDIPDEAVRSVFADDTGAVWVGLFTGGLARMNASGWTVWNTGNSILPVNNVKALAQDSSGGMWIGTTGGLIRTRDTGWTLYDKYNSPLASNNISALWVTAPDTLWIGMVNGGMALKEDTAWTTFTIASHGLGDNTIHGLAVDSKGWVWMAMPSGALNRWAGVIEKWTTLNSAIPTNSFNSISLDGDENIWLGSLDRGIIRFDHTFFSSLDTANSDVPDNTIRTTFFDKTRNVLWAGTQNGGLVKIDLNIFVQQEAIAMETPAVYPVPAGDKLYIRCADLQSATILSTGGQPLATTSDISAQLLCTLDLNRIPAGTYLLRISAGGQTFTRLITRL